MATKKVNSASATKEAVYDDLRLLHEKRLLSVMQTVEAEVIALANELKTSGGLLVNDAANVSQALNSRQEILGIFEREFTQGFIEPTVKEYDQMAVGVKDYLDSVGINVPFTQLDADIISGLKQGAFVNMDIMSKEFQAKLADEMYLSVLSNRSFADMTKSLQGTLRSIEDVRGVPMSSRAGQIAHDALLTMDRTVSAKKAQDAGIDNYLYFGSTVRDSRDFCLDHVGETRTREEWDDIGQGDWQGKSSSDLFATAGGYNCGHTLVPVPNE